MTTCTSRWHPWPIAIVLFFLVLALANGYVAYVAQRSSVSRVDDHPYERGLQYEREIQAANRFRERGWRVTTTVTGEAVGRVLLVDIGTDAGAILTGLTVHGKLLHARDSGLDRTLILTEAAPGRYAASIGEATGVWFLELVLVDGAGETLRWKEPLRLGAVRPIDKW